VGGAAARECVHGAERTLLERIIDLVPIAAAGGAGKEIDRYNNDFTDYVRAQLATFVGGHPTHTPPVIAMGAPARSWLQSVFKIKRRLAPLSMLELDIVRGRKTHVLCANHPSQYLYDTSEPLNEAHKLNHDVRWVEGKKSVTVSASPYTIMHQDLLAAGWQAAMSKDWSADPERTLREVKKRWTEQAVTEVMRSQDQEFGYAR
jgi:hypothetical protein